MNTCFPILRLLCQSPNFQEMISCTMDLVQRNKQELFERFMIELVAYPSKYHFIIVNGPRCASSGLCLHMHMVRFQSWSLPMDFLHILI